MLRSNYIKKLSLIALLACTPISLAKITQAQPSFFYPSASFFSPFASGFQSEDSPELAMILEEGTFTSFNTALQQTDILASIEQEPTVTILVPSDKAFAELPPELQQKLSDPETLEKVLQYHFIVGEISEADIKRRGVATLLEQHSVKIAGVPAENNKVSVKLNQANASEGLLATDGVIIPIDQVLIPAGI